MEILPFLYLGSAYHAARRDMLDALGITALLNVSSDCPNHFEGHYQYKCIPVEDNHKADISSWFMEAIEYIGECLRRDDVSMCVSPWGRFLPQRPRNLSSEGTGVQKSSGHSLQRWEVAQPPLAGLARVGLCWKGIGLTFHPLLSSRLSEGVLWPGPCPLPGWYLPLCHHLLGLPDDEEACQAGGGL